MESTAIISVSNLCFSYQKKQQVLKELDLDVPPASIYGFLGANGAGKSTTIRTILGLLKPQKGAIQLFGQDLQSNRRAILGQLGALIESPSLYKHLRGYDNLRIACKYLRLPDSRIPEVLDMVNLTSSARKKAKQYSTGMKQRLGLAIALLSDPELLILDEPVNGLDPNGIIEIRNIIKELNQRGKTIFLSSHILSEIEKIATRVGIIKGGQMIFQGTVKELEEVKRSQQRVRIVASEIGKVRTALNGHTSAQLLDDHTLELILDDRETIPALIRKIVEQGVDLYEVTPQRNDLEKLFINLTSNGDHSAKTLREPKS